MKYSQVKLRLLSHLQGKVHYSLDVGDGTSQGTRHEGGPKFLDAFPNFGRVARGGQKHKSFRLDFF